MDLFGDICELGGGLGLICGLVMISVDYMCDMWSSDLRFKNSPILFCQWAVLFLTVSLVWLELQNCVVTHRMPRLFHCCTKIELQLTHRSI